jgi:NAD(P)-dependent dehydrogenase (short-subunit alcohol dehydrogenase family)
MLNRNLEAASRVRDEITAQIPGAEVHSVHCDLASLASMRLCAKAIRSRFGAIALLVNNAAIVSTRHRMSEDGFELTFATNHLAPFLLTTRLLDRMAIPGRIVNVASRIHVRGTLELDDVANAKASYSSRAAYAQSKLANVMFTLALARRLGGTRVTANCLHPGVVATNLLPQWLRLVKPLISREMFDAERGAKTSLLLALSPDVTDVSGCYFDEYQRRQAPAAGAENYDQQESLWRASERWTASDVPKSLSQSRVVTPKLPGVSA